MKVVSFRWRANTLEDIEQGVRRGLGRAAEQLASGARARAPRGPTGMTADTIHTDLEHLQEQGRSAAFVATASGDGFWVHSGTNDTPPHPFFTEELDAMGPDGLARIIGSEIPR